MIELFNDSLHLWRFYLPDYEGHLPLLEGILSSDERERAERFRFDIHRMRFILSRGFLRKTLSLYLGTSPHAISFYYSEKGKPFLEGLQFNISHSDDVALFAFAKEKPIGIDIEKIKLTWEADVAKRFFSPSECEFLFSIKNEEEKARAFYSIWARKEAIVKTLGEGIFTPLQDFSVSVDKDDEKIQLTHQEKLNYFYLRKLNVYPSYAACVSASFPIKDIIQFEWASDLMHVNNWE